MDEWSSGTRDGTVRERGAFMCRVAWRVIQVWGLLLVLAVFAALFLRWLDAAEGSGRGKAAVAEVTQEQGAEARSEEHHTAAVVSFTPRSVAEMLASIPDEDDSDATGIAVQRDVGQLGADTAVAQANTAGVWLVEDRDIEKFHEEHPEQASDELTRLLKEARYAQIEGDIRLAVIKLEQAREIAADHPVVCYYLGLAYEFLRNAPKSREYFAKVVAQKEKAEKFYELAAIHLERGFSSPADYRGDLSFGTISEFREPNVGGGQKVVLTIPILMKDGLNIRSEDLHIPIHFFDIANGKSIDLTRARELQHRWRTEPIDWEVGEEILEITYYLPPLTEDERIAYGDLKYFGYTAKLYYKGEPMDCRANPPVLMLIEQMKLNKNPYSDYYYDDSSLLPPLDAVPAAGEGGLSPYRDDSDLDEGLLPF